MEKFCNLVLSTIAFSTFASVAMAQSGFDLLTMSPEAKALISSIENNRNVKCETKPKETKQDEYGYFKIYTFCHDANRVREDVHPDTVIEVRGSLEKDHFQLMNISVVGK